MRGESSSPEPAVFRVIPTPGPSSTLYLTKYAYNQGSSRDHLSSTDVEYDTQKNNPPSRDGQSVPNYAVMKRQRYKRLHEPYLKAIEYIRLLSSDRETLPSSQLWCTVQREEAGSRVDSSSARPRPKTLWVFQMVENGVLESLSTLELEGFDRKP